MKIVFFTSYLSAHTFPVFQELSKYGHQIVCVEFSKPTTNLRKVGSDINNSLINRVDATSFFTNSAYINCAFDCCVISEFTKLKDISNLNCNIFLFMSEHFVKNHKPRLLLSYLKIKFLIRKYFRRKNKFALCNSYYAAKEYLQMGFGKENIYKFGYFPNFGKPRHFKKEKRLLWCGRFLDWKHPEIALYALKYLKRYDASYSLLYVGEGKQRKTVEKLTNEYGLKESVSFVNFLSNKELLDEMAKSELFLFSSDKNEGWGVVLNEAIFNKCIIFASLLAGSTKYLCNEDNSFTFCNKRDLKKNIIEYFSLSDEEKTNIKKNEEKTIEIWSYEIAGKRLNDFLNKIVNGLEPETIDSGPMSKHFI